MKRPVLQVAQADWARYLDDAQRTVPLYDLPFAIRQFAWLYLGGPR